MALVFSIARKKVNRDVPHQTDFRVRSATRERTAKVLTLILAVVISVLTLFPISLPEPVSSGPDKIHHFIAFGGLMLPASVLYPRLLFWLIPCALIFGGLIEVIQPFVNRSGEWADFVADGVGVVAGTTVGLVLHRWLPQRMLDLI